MPRTRLYSSNAERQAAYRARLAQRQALAAGGGLVARVGELEAALAAALRRADQAEATASTAERHAGTARDRYVSLLAVRPAQVRGAPGWAKDLLGRDLTTALEHIAVLEATIADQHRFGGLVARVGELEAALAAALRRADQAEAIVSTAERHAGIARDRYVSLLAVRPAHVAGAPGWAKELLGRDLTAALEQIAVLQATVAELRRRLAATDTATAGPPPPGLNRAGRRAATRDPRRRGN